MQFRIADTFTASLARLTGLGQKAVKTTAFDLQLDPTSRGLHFPRLDRARDSKVRVTADVRLIVHKTATSVLLCYVGHHDAAYGWAERRKIERHPVTGATQLVEVRERVEEIAIASPAPDPANPPLFSGIADQTLLAYGVPVEWARGGAQRHRGHAVRHSRSPAARGVRVTIESSDWRDPGGPRACSRRSVTHPDAQRRFRVLPNVEELERALDFPWEKWAVFLHPAQRQLVDRSYAGPARVSGSAGTGKTIVALHRRRAGTSPAGCSGAVDDVLEGIGERAQSATRLVASVRDREISTSAWRCSGINRQRNNAACSNHRLLHAIPPLLNTTSRPACALARSNNDSQMLGCGLDRPAWRISRLDPGELPAAARC
jgi:hypothetical protein